MTPDEIKEELDKRKLSMAAVGRRLRPKVSRVSVSRTINQVQGSKSARIERAVAKAIGREVSDVFGQSATA